LKIRSCLSDYHEQKIPGYELLNKDYECEDKEKIDKYLNEINVILYQFKTITDWS